MRILLSSILLLLWSQSLFVATVLQATSVLRPPSLMRSQSLILQSIGQIAELQREVDMLVARGYLLFAGDFHSETLADVIGKEFVLIRDSQSPVYRYGEDEIEVPGSPHNFRTKGISEGGRARLGGDGKDVTVNNFIYIPRNATDKQRALHGWYHYRLEIADGLYPESPAEIDTLTLITPARTTELQPVGNYRIYRGEKPLQSIVPALEGQVIETITINADNPYIIYRHTQVIRANGEVSDRLSIGIYPRIALQPYLIAEQSVLITGTDAVGSKMYQFILDDEDRATLNYGITVDNASTKIPLQLIRQSDSWNEYQGNIGTTGARIESRLKRNYFNGEANF